ncbi:hypothetical protein UK23_10740 [Lentzea aerocolonigenes]|uniref:Uncharacterized protein n=1 Tax=Lentzea aerocolonigenes TaxID=68170 RepID=A0A0F0HA17_LENAE|nr:hypothetical protein UK23_10740 [Lentzea aerocolonigenes]
MGMKVFVGGVAHTPSTGFSSGAQAGSWTTVNQSWCATTNARIAALIRVFRLSHTTIRGAQQLVDGGGRGGVVGLGEAAALALTAPVDEHPVV